jgi:hypothetical protein
MKLVIDTETNAIDFNAWNKGDRSSLTKLHCLCAIDADTGYEYTFEGDNLSFGMWMVYTADEIIAHNAEFDVNVLQTWTQKTLKTPRVFCTYRRAKSMFPNGFREKRIRNPDRKLSNSLEAWGYRLGVHKDKPPIDWSRQSPKMASYCMQDCRVTWALYKFLKRRIKWGKLAPVLELCSS